MTILLLLASATSQVPIEVLQADAAQPERSCIADKSWCLTLVEGEDAPIVRIDGNPQGKTIFLPKLPAEGGFDRSFYSLWPARILSGGDGSYLIGVVHEERTMYSGGGAHASTLTLYQVTPSREPTEVLTVPWDSGSMIRACFSEKDFRDRRGACHDEYGYTATLTPSGVDAVGYPVLDYRAVATSFPGNVSRSEDSLTKGRLRKKDIVRVENDDCTFTRTFSYSVAAGRYEPDSPLPECEDYTGL